MHPVDDQLHDDVGSSKRRTRDTWVSVMKRTHRVEEVRHAPHAEVEGCVRLVGGGIRMAARDGDLSAQQPLDERARPGKLRRERHQPDGPRIEKPVEQLQIGVAARGGWVDPEAKG